MPNLEQQAVRGWLAVLRPDDRSAWPPAIRPIEATGQSPVLLVALGIALDALVPADLERLRDALRDERLLTELRSVMAQFGAARTLRLLHWLAEVDIPDCNDVIAKLTQGHEQGARALRATIEAVTRAATVRRMFAPDRIVALELACASIQEQPA
jgi:5-methylcytosine-specific restriction endonuclease McrBC regulatory subunit McrC